MQSYLFTHHTELKLELEKERDQSVYFSSTFHSDTTKESKIQTDVSMYDTETWDQKSQPVEAWAAGHIIQPEHLRFSAQTVKRVVV